MAHIENLKAFDPFADAAKGDDEAVQDGLVHVRLDLKFIFRWKICGHIYLPKTCIFPPVHFLTLTFP